MTSSLPYATPPEALALPFKDRRLSLKTMGVILILLGAASGCMGALTPLALLAPAGAGGAQQDWRGLVFGFVMYLGGGALLISAGVGALRLRRWARPVLLVTGWTWVLAGIGAMAYWIVDMPSMQQLMAASTPPNAPPPPPALVRIMSWGTGIFMFLFMVALPLVLLAIFLRNGVRQTLEHFDPHARWTDACPTPVLLLAAWMAVLSLGAALYSIYTVFPAFGYLLTEWPAVAALFVLAAAFGATAVGVYRLRRWAWWASGVLVLLWAGSLTWTFSRVPWDEFLRKAGYDQPQIDMILKFSGSGGIGTVSTMAVFAVGLLVYLVYLRKFFQPRAPAGPAPASPAEGPAQLSAEPAR